MPSPAGEGRGLAILMGKHEPGTGMDWDGQMGEGMGKRDGELDGREMGKWADGTNMGSSPCLIARWRSIPRRRRTDYLWYRIVGVARVSSDHRTWESRETVSEDV